MCQAVQMECLWEYILILFSHEPSLRPPQYEIRSRAELLGQNMQSKVQHGHSPKYSWKRNTIPPHRLCYLHVLCPHQHHWLKPLLQESLKTRVKPPPFPAAHLKRLLLKSYHISFFSMFVSPPMVHLFKVPLKATCDDTCDEVTCDDTCNYSSTSWLGDQM